MLFYIIPFLFFEGWMDGKDIFQFRLFWKNKQILINIKCQANFEMSQMKIGFVFINLFVTFANAYSSLVYPQMFMYVTQHGDSLQLKFMPHNYIIQLVCCFSVVHGVEKWLHQTPNQTREISRSNRLMFHPNALLFPTVQRHAGQVCTSYGFGVVMYCDRSVMCLSQAGR